MDATGGLPNLLRAILGGNEKPKSPFDRDPRFDREEKQMNPNSALTRSTQAIGITKSSNTDTVSSRPNRILASGRL